MTKLTLERSWRTVEKGRVRNLLSDGLLTGWCVFNSPAGPSYWIMVDGFIMHHMQIGFKPDVSVGSDWWFHIAHSIKEHYAYLRIAEDFEQGLGYKIIADRDGFIGLDVMLKGENVGMCCPTPEGMKAYSFFAAGADMVVGNDTMAGLRSAVRTLFNIT